ncbi:MAG: DUF427 domain-containing protein [Actinomycetota bacterium]|nr:DUF427 domain-containing protein [Actinomycetota bacterium]
MIVEHRIWTEESPRRVRVVFAGETIVDSTRARLLHETGIPPVHYFPTSDVRTELLERSDHRSVCPFKGEASYWTIAVDGRRAEAAVWGYEDPLPERADIKDHVAFYPERVDDWLEDEGKPESEEG